MDEHHQQAYFGLIQAILNCSNNQDEVLELLKVNQELVNSSLIKTMLQVAEKLRVEGNLDAANYLMYIAGELLTGNIENSSLSFKKDQEAFLTQVLEATADSNADPQAVYSLLSANLDKIDNNLVEIFKIWVSEKPEKIELHEVQYLAQFIFDFSFLIEQFSLGIKEINLEIAIIGYKAVLIYTYDIFPEFWAMTQYNLGLAYSQRIKGEKADNLELAMNAYENALLFYTYDSSPQNWAMIQCNLGMAYNERIKGDKAENLELAINAYKNALLFYTRDSFPSYWASTQYNLGLAYSQRVRGDKAENIELAINAYKNALLFYTHNGFPHQWTMIQHNLNLLGYKLNMGAMSQIYELKKPLLPK